jgi:hypothetical protein
MEDIAESKINCGDIRLFHNKHEGLIVSKKNNLRSMRAAAAVALGAIVVATSTTAAAQWFCDTERTFTLPKGDANFSGGITSLDAALFTQYINGQVSFSSLSGGKCDSIVSPWNRVFLDLNKDGVINNTDANEILKTATRLRLPVVVTFRCIKYGITTCTFPRSP